MPLYLGQMNMSLHAANELARCELQGVAHMKTKMVGSRISRRVNAAHRALEACKSERDRRETMRGRWLNTEKKG